MNTGGRLVKLLGEGSRKARHVLRKPRGARGFTIIEVLIVLAVTAIIFVSAAIMIAGRQRQTEFSQGARQIHSQIQQVINDVASGYYPDAAQFQCTAGAAGPVITPGSTEQGANSGCIFMGKAMQFKVGTDDPERFTTYTIAGLQKIAGTNREVTTIAEARPKVVAPTISQPSVPDASTSTPLQGGITTGAMYADIGGAQQNIGAVAFISSLARYSGGAIVSGAQQVQLVPVLNTQLGESQVNGATAIDTNLPTSPTNTNGVYICFVSSGTNQSGLIEIGGVNRQLSVTLSIKSNKTCS